MADLTLDKHILAKVVKKSSEAHRTQKTNHWRMFTLQRKSTTFCLMSTGPPWRETMDVLS